MNAKISTQHSDGLTGQGRLMIQTLVSSAFSLMVAADRCADQKIGFCKDVFTRQVEQLILQRELAAEIVAEEFEQAEDRYEAVNLKWVIEDLCRQAEVRVLEVQAERARAAGDEDLFRAITSLLVGIKTANDQTGLAATARPIPWVARSVMVG